ncbi:unnamed protein product [Urochloa decumbens]|uniref:Transposase n=1 Tax=Urochloa decumbens TaxID=240449 RepID=A0ABC9BW06_9POAL
MPAEGEVGQGNPGGGVLTLGEREEEPWDRGLNMGHGLERLTRARGGKLPIVITEGNIRPLVPSIAAKYATECNIAVRNHIPILKKWADYKRQPAFIRRFLGCLEVSTILYQYALSSRIELVFFPCNLKTLQNKDNVARFNININDPIVKNGCLAMMKNAVRQQRYKLKKEFFDPFPLHSVRKTSPVKEMSNEQWIELEHCQKNKDNRAEVKYHQTTGSRSYPVVIENLTEMEHELATPTDDGQLNSATQVRRRNVELQLVVNNQREEMNGLSKKVEETEQARIKDQEENRNKLSQLEAKLELLLGNN